MHSASELRPCSRDMCSITDEDRFGPVVNNCAHDFDFTLLFEEVFFSISLSACFIPVIVAAFFYSRRQIVKLRTGWIVIVLAATHHNGQSLLLFLSKTFHREILAGVIPRLAQAGFTLAQPYIIRRAVILLATPEAPNSRNRGIALVAAFAIVYVGLAISTAQAQHKSCRLVAMFRGGLVSIIFDKAISLSATSQNEASAMTAMGIEIERIAAGLQCFHDTWGSFVEVTLGLWLLYYQLWAADAVPILISVGKR
ncbi:hypothetical protein PENSUB_8212 [Penicillium subrubescens]|uniref:Uncharacterized protein n=1 Tax=Penicillium subrubescens TaxID=1316194 RepID=A0A1Q5TIE5_9EURO|nr:hypothetical protein PENSUB_8212 [Penicillium subrubescens]